MAPASLTPTIRAVHDQLVLQAPTPLQVGVAAMLRRERAAFNKVAANISKPNRRREWIAIFLGISFFLGALGQPWNMDWESGFFWLTVYFIFTVTIVYGLMSWFIYDTLTGIVRVSRLSRKDLKLDILDAETLVPVARWSLVMSLVFVGLILMGVIGMWEIILEWQTITGFVITIGITLLIFFLSNLGSAIGAGVAGSRVFSA